MSLTEDQAKQMISGMLEGLKGVEMQGLTLDHLEEVMAHPKAAGVVAELMPLEATSVQQGQPAPDFSLPYLPGNLPPGAPADTRVTLSDHFGKRPVALIFGSYT